MEYGKARIRNLKIKLYKVLLSKGEVILEQNYSEEAIQKKLFFKKTDIMYYLDNFFELDNGKYSLKQTIKDDFEEYSAKYNLHSSNEQELKILLKKYYEEIRDIYLNFKPTEKAQEIILKTKEIAAKLHWIYLPIYSEQIIISSDLIPEEDVLEYYNHFHTIEDLYRVIFENEEIAWDSIQGDINLNATIKLNIYSSRWGHHDIYSVKRTLVGWNFNHLSYDINCTKDGTVSGKKRDGFFSILAHDSIQYPYNGVKFALETLWEIADSTSMSIKELEIKLQEIGDWINAVEKATKNKQPNWVGYY